MFKDGAEAEVKKFIKLNVRKDKSVNKAIGIDEIKQKLQGLADLRTVKEKISIKTRQYAKRQSTWARGSMSDWTKLSPKDLTSFLKKLN